MKISEKIVEIGRIKKKKFNICEMLRISGKIYAKNGVYNITDKEIMLWLRNKDIGEKIGVVNIYDLIDREIKGRFWTKNPT